MRTIARSRLGAGGTPIPRPSALGRPGVRRLPGKASLGGHLLRGLLLAVALIFFLFPIAYLVLVSLSARSDVLAGRILPESLHWENWPDAFEAAPILDYLYNSGIAAVGGAALTLLVAVPAVYAIARFRTGGALLPPFVLSAYVAPPVVAVIPLFFLLRWAGLIDSVGGLALVYGMVNVAVAIFLLDSFVRRIPVELEEAAFIDGAGLARTLVRIVLPLMAPGIVAVGIICMILNYNEFLLALFFTFGPQSQTLPVGLSIFQGDRSVQFGQMAAASLTGMAPVYLAALFFQRWLIGGLTAGRVK